MGIFREFAFRTWYWIVSNIDKNAEVLLMNYGYSDDKQIVKLKPEDEINRYSIQLYHLLASKVELKNKHLVEIGCGRGGGLSYCVKTFSPKTTLGVDLNNTAIKFCIKHYSSQAGLTFMQGDSQALNLENESFDVVLNVESSHRYLQFDKFIAEVNRILHQGGYFLFTDFRNTNQLNELEDCIEQSNFAIIEKSMITHNVVKALELDDKRRRDLVDKLVPVYLQGIALNFAGVIGSGIYNQFVSEEVTYFVYVLQKK